MPLYGGRQACLVGTASTPLQHPGTMTVNTSPVMDGTYFSALAVARRLDSQLALMAALHYRGADYPARDALAAMGLVAFDDPGLDPVIARMMWAAPASGSNWMQSVSGRNFQSQVLT